MGPLCPKRLLGLRSSLEVDDTDNSTVEQSRSGDFRSTNN